jgi:hypothetical protein
VWALAKQAAFESLEIRPRKLRIVSAIKTALVNVSHLEIRGRQSLVSCPKKIFWIEPEKKRKPSALTFEAFKAMRSRTLENKRR